MTITRLRRVRRWVRIAAATAALVSVASLAHAQDVTPAPSATPAASPLAGPTAWDVGRNWMSVRAGYASSNAQSAGNGGAGYGFGFSRMLAPSHVNQWSVLGVEPLGFLRWTLFRKFSLGAYAHYDVLTRFGKASEIEIPATVQLVRHFSWKANAHPYLGAGAGLFYRKTYGTGDDFSRVRPGVYLTTGIDLPVTGRQVLGVDVRMARVDGENVPVNPVFGAGENRTTHLSVKLNYSIVD